MSANSMQPEAGLPGSQDSVIERALALAQESLELIKEATAKEKKDNDLIEQKLLGLGIVSLDGSHGMSYDRAEKLLEEIEQIAERHSRVMWEHAPA